ncbi:MAG: DUF5615 family PIN-like protein [Acetobacteraceae bacterium]
MSHGIQIRVFVDQCVPDSAAHAFLEKGHEVQFLRECLAVNSDDMLVAPVAMAREAVLLSLDRDFRKIATRLQSSQRRLRKLSLIQLRCRESHAKRRLQESMSLIEHEYRLMLETPRARLFVELLEGCIRTYR